MEYGGVTENQVGISMIGGHQYLHPVFLRQDKRLPLGEISGLIVTIDHNKIESAVQAGYQLPGLAVTMNAPEHIPGRDRNVVLDKLYVYAIFPVKGLVVSLYIFAPEILKDIQLDLQYTFQIRLAHFHDQLTLGSLKILFVI